MTVDQTIWQYVFWGNSIGSYAITLIAFVVFSILFNLFQALILSRLEYVAKKNDSASGNAFLHIISSIRPPFYYFLSLYLSLHFVIIDDPLRKIIHAILITWVIYEFILSIQIFIDYLVHRSFGKERERDARAALGPIKTVSSLVLWFFGALFVLSNLGVNITSLIAGLGIGGIAIALAVQNLLRDLFSSFVIYFDKPFSIGDFISVGDHEGIVRNIGLRTTRLEAMEGEEIIISNQELTTVRIKNFSKLKERRVIFPLKIKKIGGEKLGKLTKELEKTLGLIEIVRPDHISIVGFDKEGMNLEVVYFIESNKYKTYVETQEKVILALHQKLEQEKIELV